MNDEHVLSIHAAAGLPAGTYEGRHASGATEWFGLCSCGWHSIAYIGQREVRRSFQRHIAKVNGVDNAGSDTTSAHVAGSAFRRN